MFLSARVVQPELAQRCSGLPAYLMAVNAVTDEFRVRGQRSDPRSQPVRRAARRSRQDGRVLGEARLAAHIDHDRPAWRAKHQRKFWDRNG
jgi:hypothetical protein